MSEKKTMHTRIYCIYTNLPRNVIVKLLHPSGGDSQDQETFLAPSADKQTHNYETEMYIIYLPTIYIVYLFLSLLL